jgi:parallel beta-helix repeat protein
MRERRSRQRFIEQTRKRKSPLTTRGIGLGVAALAAMPAAAATFTVSNLADNGAGSLRDAINQANTTAGPDVIAFQAGLTGTITLTTGELDVYDSVDVQGPGQSVLSVSGNNSSRVFYLYSDASTIDVRIAGLTITQGAGTIGAGIKNFGETLLLEDVTLTQNHATSDGGALWSDTPAADLTIRRSTISGNTSGDDGGGVYLYHTGTPLAIENSIISGNQATNDGGGIYLYNAEDNVTISDTAISGNAANLGGGLFLYATSGNGQFIIERSTISGNDALDGGGMFFYAPRTPVTIEDSTISGNHATAGDGGGIDFYSLYNGLGLNFVTVAGNTATGNGGGLFVQIGLATIDNSILADNTAATDNDLGDGSDASFDLRYTLLETSAGANISDLGGNIFNVDPQLGALANNGGPTGTQRPALTSPVVNAADPGLAPPPLTDQRGQPRFYPTRADMGAVELVGGVIQFNPITYLVGETGGSITLTVVRDAGPDPATVSYTTNAGTASPGSDYTTTAGTLTFAPGDLSETITVPILDDNAAEGSEQFTATLSTPSPDATLGAGNPATVTITDDPTGTAQFSVSSINTTEEAGSVTVTVTRTGGTEGALTVSYSTANGSATAPSDYTQAAGTVTFPAGSAAPQTFTITLIDDNVNEASEMFTANLTGANVGAPSSVTITLAASDDVSGIPTLSFLGKLLFGLLSGVAGLYAIVRNRFSVILFALLLAGLAAAPPLSAATLPAAKAQDAASVKREKTGKFTGTLVSITNNGTTVVLNLTGGVTITLATKVVNVIDARHGKLTTGSLALVVPGAHVIVKLKMDAAGEVKQAKIKIKP